MAKFNLGVRDLFFGGGMPHSMQNLGSPTRNQTCAPFSESTVLTTGPPGNNYPL